MRRRSGSGRSDTKRVTVAFRQAPTTEIPASANFLLGREPTFALDHFERRQLAIEQRRTEIEQLQADFLADAAALSTPVEGSSWLVNQVQLRVTPAQLVWLSSRGDVALIDLSHASLDGSDKTGVEIRHATQDQQFLDAGFDGSLGSAQTGQDRMVVGIIDGQLKRDHPMWNDDASTSRLLDYFWHTGSDSLGDGDTDVPVFVDSGASGPVNHGNHVAGQLLGDLEDGQDTDAPDPDFARFGGMAPEPYFVFVHQRGLKTGTPYDPLVAYGVDVINRSGHVGMAHCNYLATVNGQVNAVFEAGVAIAHTAGNNGWSSGHCTAQSPGTASGTLVVNAVKRQPNKIVRNNLTTKSNHGDIVSDTGVPSAHNALIDFAVIGGRTSPYAAKTTHADPHTYGDNPPATSFAAPIVAGALVNLKHMTVANPATASFAAEPGYLYALALLMGDRTMGFDTGTGKQVFADPTEQFSPTWGAGRLRMRMFNAQGMDKPSKLVLAALTVEDAEIPPPVFVRPTDTGNFNRSVPRYADTWRGVAWWHEPMLGRAEQAKMNFKLCRTDIPTDTADPTDTAGGPVVCVESGLEDQKKRLMLEDPAGARLELRLRDITIPAQPLETRKVYMASFFEDTRRDDTNGPDCLQEIDIGCRACCRGSTDCDTGDCASLPN